MTERPSVPRLFISYASSDRDQVLPIVAELKGTGAEVWIDIAGIAGGESYASAIVDAIRDCDAVLLLCSAASLSSRNVHQEVALAWRFGRFILPLRLELVEIPDSLVYWLETAQWIDVLDRPPADWLPAILRALERIRTQSSPDLGERTHGEASTANVDLPAPATALLGRAGEVADLGHRLRSGARLLTLTGPGGVGKTRLALDVARSVEGAFPDGVKFVDLASITDPTLVLTAIAAALGVREAAEQGVAEDLRQFLLGRRLLLVLDNVEQVIEAAGEIAGLLTVGPGIALLVTSRIPLNVRAEQDVPVGTLPLPPVGASVEAVRASPAVSLFVERARATGAEFEVTEANAAVIAEIVRRLDGLPLAIELAAARVRIFPPDALLPRLEHPLPLLTGGARDLPERQQTLTRTIEWSYDLLAQSEQALFRRLAVFVGGASFEAVEEVAVVDGAVDPYQGLAELVRHNLIRQERSEGEPRFSMLETIREYAADQLTASGEADILRERHAMYFLQLSGGARPPRRGSDQFGPWIATVEAEHDNLRTALTWAVDRPDVEVALQIASNIAQLWFTRGHFSEGRRWFEQIFAIGTEGLPTLRSQAYSAASLLARVQGDHRTSLAHAELAVTLARQSDDRAVLVRALYTLGGAYQAMARTSQATVFLEEALALARGVEGLEAQVGSILNVLGDVTLAQGDHARAFELVEEGLALKRAVGDEFGSAVCLNMLGTIAFNQKDYVRAVAYFEESLAIDKKIGDREGAATAMLNLGGVAREQGDMVRAIDLTREALEAFLDLGDRAGNAFALGSFAAIAERRGEPALAVLWLGASAAIREAIGEPVALEQREEYDEFRSRLSRELGPETFASQWARGQTQPEDAVIADVLEWARVGGMPPGSESGA